MKKFYALYSGIVGRDEDCLALLEENDKNLSDLEKDADYYFSRLTGREKDKGAFVEVRRLRLDECGEPDLSDYDIAYDPSDYADHTVSEDKTEVTFWHDGYSVSYMLLDDRIEVTYETSENNAFARLGDIFQVEKWREILRGCDPIAAGWDDGNGNKLDIRGWGEDLDRLCLVGGYLDQDIYLEPSDRPVRDWQDSGFRPFADENIGIYSVKKDLKKILELGFMTNFDLYAEEATGVDFDELPYALISKLAVEYTEMDDLSALILFNTLEQAEPFIQEYIDDVRYARENYEPYELKSGEYGCYWTRIPKKED